MSSTSAVLRGLTTGLVLLVVASVSAQDKPVGKVSVESKTIAVGIGVSWGDGKLTYQGKDHQFSISGLSVADLGISKATATGDVYNLKKLSDFAGNYVAAQAGAAVGGGAGAVTMRNQNGVVMQLTGTGTGVQLTLAAKGVEVKLKN
jgi:Envelope integrity protein A